MCGEWLPLHTIIDHKTIFLGNVTLIGDVIAGDLSVPVEALKIAAAVDEFAAEHSSYLYIVNFVKRRIEPA